MLLLGCCCCFWGWGQTLHLTLQLQATEYTARDEGGIDSSQHQGACNGTSIEPCRGGKSQDANADTRCGHEHKRPKTQPSHAAVQGTSGWLSRRSESELHTTNGGSVHVEEKEGFTRDDACTVHANHDSATPFVTGENKLSFQGLLSPFQDVVRAHSEASCVILLRHRFLQWALPLTPGMLLHVCVCAMCVLGVCVCVCVCVGSVCFGQRIETV